MDMLRATRGYQFIIFCKRSYGSSVAPDTNALQDIHKDPRLRRVSVLQGRKARAKASAGHCIGFVYNPTEIHWYSQRVYNY